MLGGGASPSAWRSGLARRFVYPQTGALMRHFQDGDFLDSQIAPLPDTSLSAADLAVLTVFAMPGWVMVLLGMRDMLMKPFGIKTGSSEGYSPPSREELASGRYSGVFGVESVSEDEVTLGTNDRHLDFRISVLKTRSPKGHVALSTWVHPHDIWGRLYLGMVYPFHKLIVWRMLANLKDRAKA